MNLQLGPKIFSQNYGDVDSAEGIDLDADGAGAKRSRDIASSDGVAPASDDLGGGRERVGIPQKHHVQPAAAQHPGSGPRRTLPSSPVEHFHGDSLARGRHERRSRSRRWLGAGAKEKTPAGYEQNQSYTYREPAPVVTRLFQKRRVGSRMGHPDSTR
jgi:hypothetical protein